MDANVCPFCRKPLVPTAYREIGRGWGGPSMRRPTEWGCLDRCADGATAEEYNAAVRQLNKEINEAKQREQES